MLRDKDIALAEACESVWHASQEALRWFERHPQLVGSKATELGRELRKVSVRARKLAGAARRPMSVAVYGVSQVGKSFLTNTMTSPQEKPTKVLLGPVGDAIAMDYGEEINPEGGKETTGLVTRFSIRPMDGSTKEYPVALRILRETDIFKILVNTHAKDLKVAWETGKSAAADNLKALAQRITELGASVGAAGLSADDVTELRGYIETSLPHHPLAAAGNHPESNNDPANMSACELYWTALETNAAGLGANQRAEVFGPLWGELSEFSDLYLVLKQALDQLGHPEWAFAPIATIRDREFGVLHVQTLFGMDPAHASTLSGPAANSLVNISIMSGETKSAIMLPQPIVTALTRELRLTMEHMPWAFLEHADILDFPGARSRGGNSIMALREDGAPNTRSECYLRGKVDVLFDSYVDELEANSLLLMLSDKPLEVVELPDMVEGWINITHGEKPADRQKVNTSLFVIAACADTLFVDKGGAKDFSTAIFNRLDGNLSDFGRWKDEWTPGKKFKNSFLFRNPKYPAHHIAKYAPKEEGGSETGYADGFDRVREQFTHDFLADELVQQYFDDPQTKVDNCLKLNDGGVTLLAEALAPVCDPDQKYSQIQPAIRRIAERCLELVSPYFERDDVQTQIDERQATVRNAIRALSENSDRIGPLINRLQTTVSAMHSSYMRFKADSVNEAQEASGNNPIMDEIFGGTADEEAPPALQSGFGAAAISDWRDQLASIALNEPISHSLAIPQDALTGVVREVLGVGERAGLEHRIDAYTAKVEAMPSLPREIAYRIGLGATEIINNAVLSFETEPRQHQKSLDAPEYPDLPAEPDQINAERRRFLVEWLRGLHEATALNVRGGKGSLIDPEENRKLGEIIKTLEEMSEDE